VDEPPDSTNTALVPCVVCSSKNTRKWMNSGMASNCAKLFRITKAIIKITVMAKFAVLSSCHSHRPI